MPRSGCPCPQSTVGGCSPGGSTRPGPAPTRWPFYGRKIITEWLKSPGRRWSSAPSYSALA
eukprot:6079427-Alexandrium_andersonii.AAC.1